MEFDWVAVPGGVLTRGTPADEIDALARAHDLPRSFFAKQAPRSEVSVEPFRMTRTPATLGQWTAFCASTGWPPPVGAPTLPVEVVTWEQATEFCSWVADALSADVRLPTENEWARSARGGDARQYPWGDTYEPRRANLAELGLGHALPVGSLPAGASPFGLLDMAGNVDEWTSTVYEPYLGAPPC